jgi:pimeloyl-ACP methyl ester carboxylesterase
MNKVISKDGTAIAFDKIGSGPTVILVGGATVFRATNPNAAELANMLAPHFTVINYDRRGRGESEDAPTYAVEREIEDIEALINEGGGSAYLCGFSSGGALALWAASELGPDKITKVVAYEPPFAVGDQPRLPEDYVEKINMAIAENRRGDALELFMTVAVGMPIEEVKPMRQEPWWSMLEPIAHTLAYDGMIMGDSSVPTERLANVTVPVLVMAGTAGPEWFREAAQAAVKALPQAEYRALKDQTHDVDPKVLAPELEVFFKVTNKGA